MADEKSPAHLEKINTEQKIRSFLEHSALCGPGDPFEIMAMNGGVSSDIWRVTTPDRQLCVKAALAQLRTKEAWFAPVSRNHTEVMWFQTVATYVPEHVPHVLSHDPGLGLFAMNYFPPDQFPVWKQELSQGRIAPDDAADVGAILGTIHLKSAQDPSSLQRFDTYDQFEALRVEPYLRHLTVKHPDLAARSDRVIQNLSDHRFALIHGDVSPKNILIGPKGPIYLDAETACFGDPVFDLSFCLNHLLLKMIWRPEYADMLEASYHAMIAAYMPHIQWETPADFIARATRLLLFLLLARIDGKSPVEYITKAQVKDRVRKIVRPLILADPDYDFADIVHLWREGLE